jgi:hypothetical protein
LNLCPLLRGDIALDFIVPPAIGTALRGFFLFYTEAETQIIKNFHHGYK